jgi:hypothetical protein
MTKNYVVVLMLTFCSFAPLYAQDFCGFPVSLSRSGFESGEQASSAVLPSESTPLTLTLQGPADGSTVNVNAVQYFGTYSGPPNTGISANTVGALVGEGVFVLPRINLEPGTNQITFRYGATDVSTVLETRTITYQPTPSPDVLFASRSPGDYAPTVIPFTLATRFPAGQTVRTRIQIDYNGDGSFEVDIASPSDVPARLQFAYELPGLYVALARVTFDDGSNVTPLVIVEDRSRVLIQSLAFTRQTLCSLYFAMRNRLRQPAIAQALNTLTPAIKPSFQTVWTSMQSSGQLVPFANTMDSVVNGRLSRNSAELQIAVKTPVAGEFEGYDILFRRDESGVWRIAGM